MNRTLIVIANASLARLLYRDPDTGLCVPQATMHHVESRLPGRDPGDDRPGREAADRASAPNRFEPRQDVRRQELLKFAQAIARAMRLRREAHEFGDTWLLASSPFLAELKAALDPSVCATVRLSRATDLTGLDLSEIEHRLRALGSEQARAANPVG